LNKYILSYVINLLEKKGLVPGESNDKKKKYSYIESGHIDSIGLVYFILEIEREFDIEITPEESSSQLFGVVSGVVSIIEKKLKI